MTKANFTSISIVLDRSGSMQPLIKETIAGFNSFLEEQKKVEGDAVLTLATFANDYTLVHDGVPIQQVPALTKENYKTSGFTALLDAIARTINATGAKLASMAEHERPSQVLLVIITDGEENHSREFTHIKVMEMIKHQQEKYAWSVVYLGANQDAIQVGASMGIAAGNTATYGASVLGTKSAYSSISSNTSSLRSKGIGATADFFALDPNAAKIVVDDATSTQTPKDTQ